MHKIILFLTIIFLAGCGDVTQSYKGKPNVKNLPATEFKAGDIVFQQGSSLQCEAVKAATGSEWSHCGIILPHNGELMVLEAVQPVQWESIANWIRRGDNKICKTKRLQDESTLTDTAIEKMVSYGESLVGKNYDIYFNWSDEEWYCSELVWKVYHEAVGLEVGIRKPLKSYNLEHPIVKEIMKQRYGNAVPLEEMMISPGAIFECDLLEGVAAGS